MPTNQSAVLEVIQGDLAQIKATLNQNRLFSIVEMVRDEVNDLSQQIEGTRSDIRDLRNLVFQQSATSAD